MALNRGRHLCSAGRPSRWALAHILVRVTSDQQGTFADKRGRIYRLNAFLSPNQQHQCTELDSNHWPQSGKITHWTSHLLYPSTDSRGKGCSIVCTGSPMPIPICCKIHVLSRKAKLITRMVPRWEAVAVGSCRRLDVSLTSTDRWQAANPEHKCQHRIVTNRHLNTASIQFQQCI